MSAELEALAPCPFCGSGSVEIDCMSRNADGLCDEPAVCCDNCKTITSFDLVTAAPHFDVVPLWNTRALATPPKGASNV